MRFVDVLQDAFFIVLVVVGGAAATVVGATRGDWGIVALGLLGVVGGLLYASVQLRSRRKP